MIATVTAASETPNADAPRSARPPGPPRSTWLSDTIELGAHPEAVRLTRSRTRLLLHEWQLADLADDAETIVTELVTNAVEATQAALLDTPFRLTLIAGLRTLLITVWDAAPGTPTPQDPEAEAISGRGLIIVQALAGQWDCKPGHPARGGKTVRALLRGPRTP